MAETIMDESLNFPVDISYGSSGGPGYSTDVVIMSSGHETRNINWTQARHSYNAAFGIRDQFYLNELVEFFHACKGKAYGFRYKDWSDYNSLDKYATAASSISSIDQLLGTANAIQTEFQIIKNYTYGFITTRIINKPVVGTLLVAVDGVLQTEITDYTVNTTTGVITFLVAPADTLDVTAGYEFDVPCRFDTDTLSINLEMYQHGSIDVPILELRI